MLGTFVRGAGFWRSRAIFPLSTTGKIGRLHRRCAPWPAERSTFQRCYIFTGTIRQPQKRHFWVRYVVRLPRTASAWQRENRHARNVMALATQARELAALGASDRLSIFGINSSGAQQLGRMESANQFQTFPCYFSPVRSQEQLDEAMFKDIHDTILRIAKTETNFSPVIGKNVVLIAAKNDGSNLTVRISELGHSGMNPEYVIGCKNVF